MVLAARREEGHLIANRLGPLETRDVPVDSEGTRQVEDGQVDMTD
jgi:autonomous glycyl radical cofactor GrcA